MITLFHYTNTEKKEERHGQEAWTWKNRPKRGGIVENEKGKQLGKDEGKGKAMIDMGNLVLSLQTGNLMRLNEKLSIDHTLTLLLSPLHLSSIMLQAVG